MSGPKVYNAIATARSFSENMSDTEPPPTATGAAPAIPASQI
jgi:hypothetical protein